MIFTGLAITVFLSAFLLFQIQPMMAKIILPWFGGSAEVWTICLLFFQVVLLLGYTYAHLMFRVLRPRPRAFVHTAVLLCSIPLLTVIPAPSWKPQPEGDPTVQIVLLLARCVGLPYFLLSANSPLLQTWLTEQFPGTLPYRLFSFSNAGSMLALLSYPVLVEPYLFARSQARIWSRAYLLFALMWVVLAFVSKPCKWLATQMSKTEPPPPLKHRLIWLSLAGCASTLLLAVTNYLTQNIASVPFLWIVPLALFLLSFILCFDSDRWYRRSVWVPLSAAALCGIAWAIRGDGQNLPLATALFLFCGGLLACCMTLHGELARLKPNPEYLTSFYLTVSLGGAGGGIFVGVLAPRIFKHYSELPIALVGCAFLLYVTLDLDRRQRGPISMLPVALAAGLAFYLAPYTSESEVGPGLAVRNFYGVLRVRENMRVRQLRNGVIVHGEQLLDPARRAIPTTYYGETSGVGIALRETAGVPDRRIGVIGLGVGTVAAYGKPGDYFRLYEVNPLDIKVASTEFSYLRDSKAKFDMVPGDGRFSLEREPCQNFDLLIVDAFTGDSIPVHLLTREAFALYFRHLKAEGILAIHISNLHLNLHPVVKAAAAELGRESVLIQSPGDPRIRTYLSVWVLIGQPGALARIEGTRAVGVDRSRLWTDDHNDLLQVLR